MGRKPVKECPTDLQKILDEVNLLPVDESGMKNFKREMDKMFIDAQENAWPKIIVAYDNDGPAPTDAQLDAQGRGHRELIRQFEKRIESKIASNLRPLARWLGPGLTRASMEYTINELREKRLTLRRLIDAVRIKQSGSTSHFPIHRTIYVEIGDEWKIDVKSGFEIDIFWQVVTKHRLDRLLECPVCKKIVWRKKARSETCGAKECADHLGNIKRRKN